MGQGAGVYVRPEMIQMGHLRVEAKQEDERLNSEDKTLNCKNE